MTITRALKNIVTSDLGLSQVQILLVIGGNDDTDIADLIEETGLKEMTIRHHIRILRENGHLTSVTTSKRSENGEKRALYSLTVEGQNAVAKALKGRGPLSSDVGDDSDS